MRLTDYQVVERAPAADAAAAPGLGPVALASLVVNAAG